FPTDTEHYTEGAITMIYTVTLNPSLDRTLTVRELRVGELNRAHRVHLDLSGKGINVSRQLRRLGIPSRVIGFVAGSTGRAIQDGLTAEGFETIFIEVDGETRQNITILDETTNACTKINEPGASVGPHDLEAMSTLIRETATQEDLWVFSGSLPPGAPADFYARLIGLVQSRGGRAFLDTSGAALRLGLTARPYAIKPNSAEASELLGVPLTDNAGHIAAARRLRAEGPTLVCLTRGADGLVLSYGDALLLVPPLPIQVVSPIGAGDAALAGLVWAVNDGCNPLEMARRALACSAAAAMQEGTEVGDRATVEQLLTLARNTPIAG
ncbi:MAG: 1-phosphofructokinase, partial [Anaerolineae bacterium]|nr:1-phosphofructokinase [Anaerolineae bacterium]